MTALVLFAVLAADVAGNPVIRDRCDRLELNTVVDESGSEVFTMLVAWEGDSIRYVHFWNAEFGLVARDEPGKAVIVFSDNGPRELSAPVLVRSVTTESVELVHARQHGRQRRGLSLRYLVESAR